MPIHPEDLAVFFDRFCKETLKNWDDRVDDGEMTEYTLQYKRARLEEIGSILTALADGKAALTYPSKPRREPAPMIWLSPGDRDDV